MHTRASNSELVEPLPEPERTLNRRLHRRNRRVPFEQRNNPNQHPRTVYPPILDINYFRHFLDILRNYDPMDDDVGCQPCCRSDSRFCSSNSDTDKIMARMDAMTMKIDAQYKDFQSRSNNQFHEGSEILHSIEGTILEEKLFVEFDEFIAMTTDENSESESDIGKNLHSKKLTFYTNYMINKSLDEPPYRILIIKPSS
ncbi:hypothetical protein Tco_0439160 [Tanacetum coccineum]